jgi:class 3 adenylate cyclase
MSELPRGTVTFVLTDIEGSTRLFQSLGHRYQGVLEEHRTLLREAFERHGGVVVSCEGDAFLVAFASANDAVVACLAAQQALATHKWPSGATVAVRMGLNTGDATPVADQYVSVALHQAARVCAAAHGGQVLLAEATARVADGALPPEVWLEDLGAHRLRDFDRPVRLFQAQHGDFPRRFPMPRVPADIADHLPTQRSSFVGRTADLAEVQVLVSQSRLLNVVGTGGVGKTRFAIELARDVAPDHPDGVWMVQLAPIEAGDLVPDAVARAVGVGDVRGRSPREVLVSRLAASRTLILLDNCEHLLDATAGLASDLVDACPGLTLLATSREPLNITGEVVWRLQPPRRPARLRRRPPLRRAVCGAASPHPERLRIHRRHVCPPRRHPARH